MLPFRIFKLVIVGFSLIAISYFLRFLFATVRGVDRLLLRPFFDVEGLTEEIHHMAHRRQNISSQEPVSTRDILMRRASYRWICNLMRRLNGLGTVRVPPTDTNR